MFTRVCLSLTVLMAMPAWPQVSMNITNFSNNGGEEMMAPPPVSGQAYPTGFTSEARSNYLHAGLGVNTAYSDNLFTGVGSTPVSDIIYSIYPSISIDKTTMRLHWALSYLPGFTFYQRTSSYNQMDQRVAFNFQYRLTPHITGVVQENFLKTSSLLSQPDQLSGGAISGTIQPPPVAVIAPVANQIVNGTNLALTYQFARDDMIGGGGSFANLRFLNSAQVPGLSDSDSRGWSAFYSHRFSVKHYVGVAYQYLDITSYPIHATSETQTDTIIAFYTVYLKPTFSLSFAGGPQHSEVAETPLPTYRSWSPSATASIGWQGSRTSFAVRYSEVITGGGGLVGAFHSSVANGSWRWRLARTWNLGAGVGYANFSEAAPSSFESSGSGHSLYGNVSVQHPIGEHLQMELGYTRLHQIYSDIPVISNSPNTNREYFGFSYQFARPLGGR